MNISKFFAKLGKSKKYKYLRKPKKSKTPKTKKVKPSKTRKSKGKKRGSRGKKGKCKQTGGVGFNLDVSSCPIGGMSPVTATSDCPANIGPGNKGFPNAVYNLPNKQLGGRYMSRSRSPARKGRSRSRIPSKSLAKKGGSRSRNPSKSF